MDRLPAFQSLTVQFYVPDLAAGLDFYTRALGRPPNFAPTPDFQEWDHIAPNVTFQVAQGKPRPTYPLRFGVTDLERERERIVRDARPPVASSVQRFEGVVAVCDFVDPWGNTFGLYQVLFTGEPRSLEGSVRGHQTEVEARIESGAGRYEDIRYEVRDGVATIAIHRPEVLNAFRAQTCEELIDALQRAGWDRSVGVIVLTGDDRAFCTGGDQSAHHGRYVGRGTVGLPVEELHSSIRDVPVPVIAKVRGYAIGGGNVLATLCDLTLAAESAVFGQVGPKVGSVDPGFGTAYLTRIVGEKKAREMWYLCRRYTAREALEMGLVNAVVAEEDLDAEVDRWCRAILANSPTALTVAKRSFNADSENIRGLAGLGMQALALYYDSDESREGAAAFREKRVPQFRRVRDGAAPGPS